MRAVLGIQYPVYRSTSGETDRDVFGATVPTAAAGWRRAAHRRLPRKWLTKHRTRGDGQ